MVILAIESTCDETGTAVVRRSGDGIEVLSNVVASSSGMHEKYGGIVPEVAAREQIKVIIPTIKEALEKAGVEPKDIGAVAVSCGPGLVGSLLIGVETAKALALAWNKPLLAVNHMEGHVLANWIINGSDPSTGLLGKTHSVPQVPELPAVGLVVSGGHTDLIYMKSLEDWQWLGGTRDDSVGECLDKGARVLGLSYPGGPAIEKAAEKVKEETQVYSLPRPLLHEDTFEMSFSGLKSAVIREVERSGKGMDEKKTNLLAKELLDSAVEILVNRTMKAVENFKPKTVLMAGGVAASKRLREDLRFKIQDLGLKFFVPEFMYCTDNAAMIGAAAILRPEMLDGKAMLELRPEPGLEVV